MSITPQITYNGKTITFPEDVYKVQLAYPRIVTMMRAASNVAGVQNVTPDDMHAYGVRWQKNVEQADFKRYITQWWEWASKGGAWRFARDNTKTALTSLTAGAAAGATSIIVASITGISSGDQLILRNSTDQMLVKVSGAPSGSTITLSEALDVAFTNGSRVRHETYWPGRLLDNSLKAFPIVEAPPLHFGVEFVFTEDMN